MLTTPIRRMTISGFRGILAALELSFVKADTGRLSSMFIYGSNGTGKSSITDAWEWFQDGRIRHLRREGAEEASYPHIDAQPGDTFIEVEFADETLGRVHLEYDPERVTRPKVTGDRDAFRQMAPHPCQLRFEDLTRFVFLPKAEKYDALAQLMGFSPQVEVQKALRRVERQHQEKVDQQAAQHADAARRLAGFLSLEDVDEATILQILNAALARHAVSPVASIAEMPSAATALRQAVESDPGAQEAADIAAILDQLRPALPPPAFSDELGAYLEECGRFRQADRQAFDLLRLRLYEEGSTVLRQIEDAAGDTNICPLCGARYDGDLKDHVARELAKLAQLKNTRDAIEARRAQLQRQAHAIAQHLSAIARPFSDHASLLGRHGLSEPPARTALAELVATVLACLDRRAEQLDEHQTATLRGAHHLWQPTQFELASVIGSITEALKKRLADLGNDATRAQLVSDFQLVSQVLAHWTETQAARDRLNRLRRIHALFAAAVEDYVACSIADVQARFAAISDDVARFFCALEQDSPCLSTPTLRLLTDQDRAVELEVGFYGEPIRPAYKFLSESQLNSFGLAIFLASVRHFNSQFHFLLLDDIINSFDGYKRPRVVDLLREEFADYQVLLLTHDNVWYDHLCNRCPEWIPARFVRIERGIGPVPATSAAGALDRIKELINDDRASEAGRSMGAYLEQHVAELCEAFTVLVEYRRRNDHTLIPLVQRFRAHAKQKLGAGHPLPIGLQNLEQNTSFRNLCAHWKDPAIAITRAEMTAVVALWEAVRSQVWCPACARYARYDGRRAFVCRCRALVLEP